MEAIIESASRGFYLASHATYGNRRVKVDDGGKERPILEIDPVVAPIVQEMFERSARGQGLNEICNGIHRRNPRAQGADPQLRQGHQPGR